MKIIICDIELCKCNIPYLLGCNIGLAYSLQPMTTPFHTYLYVDFEHHRKHIEYKYEISYADM